MAAIRAIKQSDTANAFLCMFSTAFSGIPMLNGHPINLHKLYLTVCALGGCRKVSTKAGLIGPYDHLNLIA